MLNVRYIRLLISGLAILCAIPMAAQQPPAYNVLFLSIDDLKPALGVYGDRLAKSPAIDALAHSGMVFLNNHCQQAVCAPSRASLLSGLRPDRTKVWDLTTVPRKANPSMLSLPEHFRKNGYETIAFGKIFHLTSSGPGQDAPSWSIPFTPSSKPEYIMPGKRKATETVSVADTAYQDGDITTSAIEYLQQYKSSQKKQPFFLAVGYKKPHLPFAVPKKYWDIFQRSAFSLPAIRQAAKNTPHFTYTRSGELRNYADIPDSGTISNEKQLELIHGYYAAVAYMDAQFEKLIQELKALNLYENTIIVLWGDHGWHLGDHGQWTKHTNYEQATRSPLIIKAPQTLAGLRTNAPTELVDVFPTLCELAGLSTPEQLDGQSLVPLLKKQAAIVKPFAISQYPRGNNNKMMGYALRNQRYRLVMWVGDQFTTAKPYNAADLLAVELYDYEKDPQESENLANKPAYANIKNELMKEMVSFFNQQYEKINQLNKQALRPFEEKANALVADLTIDEKLEFVSGGPRASIRGIKRLGLRSVYMSDGPLGVKSQVEGERGVFKKATAFPSAITMASTWNPALIDKIGKAIGIESRFNGIDILLGPSVNMHRIHQNGRNFEYFGEDPWLASRIAVAYIKGLQSTGVLANVKHFAANNTEFNRYKSNSIVDERSLHEIYFPAFEAAVKEAESATLMTAHNLLNGVHCSESSYLLDTILRQQWGFKGFVISDWNSSYGLVPTVNAGVDIEMPMGKVMGKESLRKALQKGLIKEEALDLKISRMLETCLRFGLYEPAAKPVQPNWNEHFQLALQAAEQGTVLLKNEAQLLPLNLRTTKKIVVIGGLTTKTPAYGGGAAGMPTYRMQSLFNGIKEAAGKKVQVVLIEAHEVDTEKAKEQIRLADAVIAAVGFDAAIEGEAHDRPFNLPADQVAMLKKLTALNKHTVVTVYAGGAVNAVPWLQDVQALLMAWYMGDATGHVIGNMIFGTINPSGKLPISWENEWKDAAAFASYDKAVSEAGMPALFKPAYEKLNGPVAATDQLPMVYAEGVFMGYRHFTTKNIRPLFPFGYGLSYTSFEFANLSAQVQGDSIEVELRVRNSGKIAGAEVVQLYVQDEQASVERPLIELKRFERVELKPGESRIIRFRLYRRDLSFWDINSHNWKAEPGIFVLHAGNSTENLPLKTSFNLK